jgi:hypothetical protein
MDKDQLQTLLGSLAGHLVTSSSQQEKEYQKLHQLLSRSLLSQDIQQLKGSNFSFENADLFSSENIPAARADFLQSIAASTSTAGAAPEFRVFAREVPVRSTQLPTSVPLWAAGAAVERTIGPFTNKDGRQFWFDFFRIERLVALYVQGKPDPALLFKVNVGIRFIDINLPLAADPSLTYQLTGGSIWINSQLLAVGAPAGDYTGLTIQGGTVSLSAAPQLINGRLTVAPNTIITVRLRLRQPAATDADASSPYGIDARKATLQLPQKFSFHFSSAGSAPEEVAPARWSVYGHEASFRWNEQKSAVYDNLLHRVLIPFTCSTLDFSVSDCQSPFHTLQGAAPITESAWALPAGQVDILNPTPAAGIGAMLVKCGKGLTNSWKGLQGGELNLTQPYVMAEPGRIGITDLAAGNLFCTQDFKLWKDELNPYGTSVRMLYPQATPFFYNTFANGNEALLVLGHADVRIDRPVTVAGEALAIHSKNSLLLLAASKALQLIYLYDDNILADNLDLKKKPPVLPKSIALAMHNALFKVTPVNGCLLFGALADDFIKIKQGILFLTFGLQAYLPTLPDPYAANLGGLRSQFRGGRGPLVAGTAAAGQNIWMWLVCQLVWQPGAAEDDKVEVSFHFAPLQNQFQVQQTAAASNTPSANTDAAAQPLFSTVNFPAAGATGANAASSTSPAEFQVLAAVSDNRLPDYGSVWDESTGRLQQDMFALLDVSTNADLLGVSFDVFSGRRMALVTTFAPAANQTTTGFPLQVQGLDVVSQGTNVRAFTVPQISWEPVANLTPPQVPGDPSAGFNYYPNDGGPTRIINNSNEQVALAPIPLTNFLVNAFEKDGKFAALTLFTLPFGIKALALLQKQYEYQGNARKGSEVLFNSKSFENGIKGARQLEIDAGDALVEGESDMFMGSTIQLNNVLELDGTAQGNSTLGRSVTKIFNNEFLLDPFELIRQRGVPLTRMDLSGYGASIFSNWLNPKATIAATSQAKFDVFVGRCGHEIIQVKSLLYPWAIKVVRTITLFRTASGYVYRYDSGWRAESDGRYDFTYYVNVDDPANPGKLKPEERQAQYEIHPGVIKGLFNVKEIKETTEITPFTGQMAVSNGEFYVDINGKEQKNTSGADMLFGIELQPVFFNADVEVEGVVSGFATKNINGQEKKLVASKRILGFVQLAPRGMPLTKTALKNLIIRQQGSIGGPLDCVVNIHNSGQQMRLGVFDVSNSFAANGTDPIFVAAGRGSVILPKDGSWGVVKHQQGTGEVTPVPETLSVPLIRIGKLIKQGGQLVLDKNPATQLLRLANPTEILRAAVSDTINYGFLHSTDTQKALILTPSFRQGLDKLLSKTPPLFADAFRIVNSKGVFPNIGDAASNFGDVISLAKNGTEFTQNALTDGGKQVLELMQIDKVVSGVREEGYKLLKKVEEFDLPSTEWVLIEIGGAFKIYIEYKADNVQKPQGGGTKNLTGALNFDVDSFANNLADRWKSRMANVGLVVDLGPIKRLMTIKGNWDAKKGAEAQYKGSDGDPDFPSPQIEFAPELQPVIEILQILQDLQGENYKDAFEKGLKLAMSNKAGTWEYKFDAAKEIPVVRFPMPNEVYNQPTVPLKLEAGLKLGAYFNAALKVTTDPKQLLPTAGGYLEFYGRLSVMCVSLAAATVYAVGQVDLRIGADTKTGPFLAMKFGFGAQLVVGLPVVGNVSVLFMTGVEIYVDSVKVNVTASLLFQGHAELLGGLVAVTITIEAKGTISRANDRTDLAAQVTFGLDISIFLVINISFSTSWQEQRQIA